MTTDHLTDQQQADDHAIQILSNEGAQCGDCGDQPGDRICPNCERCRGWYVAALRKAGWAPQPEHDALLAEVRRLRARIAEHERPSTEAERNALRQSFTALISQAEEDRDHEGAFDLACQLHDREQQWAREDAAARPSA